MIKPFFSVVIPTFERPEDLKTCLQSLVAENQPGAPEYEVIVSDDSLSDRCCKIVTEKFPQFRWGHGKRNGPAGNRNAGVEKANGKWIVFMDDDCIADTNHLAAFANAISNNPKINVFEGRIFAERKRESWSEGCPENESGGMLWTSNLCIKKMTFIKLNGFDERFHTSYEDVDFSYRLKKLKYKSIFVKEAAVCHPWRSLRKKGKNNWKSNWHEVTSLLLFCEKYKYKNEEHSNPSTYLKNFSRIISKDLINCACVLKLRGFDILLKDALISLIVFFLLTIRKTNK